jgi:hypothetical protein
MISDFDIQIVDGVVRGTGWSDRLTKSGLTKDGVSVVLSACVAVSSYPFQVRRGHLREISLQDAWLSTHLAI